MGDSGEGRSKQVWGRKEGRSKFQDEMRGNGDGMGKYSADYFRHSATSALCVSVAASPTIAGSVCICACCSHSSVGRNGWAFPRRSRGQCYSPALVLIGGSQESHIPARDSPQIMAIVSSKQAPRQTSNVANQRHCSSRP